MAAPPPPLYRWKDRHGQAHVTTTVPPPGALTVETLRHADDGLADGADQAAPTHQEMRASLESVLSAETVAYWHGIDKAFSAARSSGDTKGQLDTLDSVFASAMLGDGLWATPLIPVVLAALCCLLAWWLSAGRPNKTKAAIWAGFAVSCLLLSHVGVQFAIHGPQARRLGFALSMLPNYLGDCAQLEPWDVQAIAGHVKALSDASSPTSTAWTFPRETRRARRTLARLLKGLEGGAPLMAEAPPPAPTTADAEADAEYGRARMQ
jgi:hypothetical protein